MNPKLFLAARAALLVGLLSLEAGTARAASITYNIDIPSLGTGWLSYDNSSITDEGSGSYSSPLTGFSFTYNGWTYTLADAIDPAGDDLAWLMDTGAGPEFVGVQYLGAHGGDTLEFTGGFGGGDMGIFAVPSDFASLDSANFALPNGNVPEPATWACLTLGLALAFGRNRLGRGGGLARRMEKKLSPGARASCLQ